MAGGLSAAGPAARQRRADARRTARAARPSASASIGSTPSASIAVAAASRSANAPDMSR